MHSVRTPFPMNATLSNELDQEPMGIVISRGSRAEHVPTVFAYVWAPAPEVSDKEREAVAA